VETKWDAGGPGYHYENEAQRTPWLVNATLYGRGVMSQCLKGSLKRLCDTTHKHCSEWR